MNLVEKSIKKSSEAFINFVWPKICQGIGGGKLIPVEGVTTDEMSQKFDTISGIDFWQIMHDDKGIRGIASRCQPMGVDWHTFTIRRSLSSGRLTEYHKRKMALTDNNGILYPALTIQAYMHSFDGPLISVGYMYTRDLFDAVDAIEWPINRNGQDGNEFLVVDWYKLEDMGYRIRIIKEIQ